MLRLSIETAAVIEILSIQSWLFHLIAYKSHAIDYHAQDVETRTLDALGRRNENKNKSAKGTRNLVYCKIYLCCYETDSIYPLSISHTIDLFKPFKYFTMYW